ncbi:AAA family ATPase [Haliangium sp.]|uniref:AAA family ATPase n=1 Tax=Haliangium sp. TaxID=2663208 RepID=UPI003D0AE90F
MIQVRTHAALAEARSALAGTGAVLVEAAGDEFVFAVELGDRAREGSGTHGRPPERERAGEIEVAVDAARRLVDGGVGERVVVGLASLSARLRRDGSLRVLGRIPKHCFDAPSDARGVVLSEAAAAAMGPRLPAPAAVPLLGRDAELAALAAHAGRALATEVPGLATVVAPPGHGKSAFAAALAGQAGGWPAPAGLRPRVVSCTLAGQDRPSSLAGVLAAVLGGGSRDAEDPGLRASAAAPGALRLARVRAAGRALLACAAAQPLVLIVDDVHLSDDDLLATLEYVTRVGARARLWVCVLARPELDRARPSWGRRAGGHHRLALGPLGEADAEALARAVLHPVEHVPARVLGWMRERTQGVPLYLVELGRELRRRGAIRRRVGGDGWYLAAGELPGLSELPTARWLAERELATLTPALIAHAQLCALLGSEFDEAEVAGVQAAVEVADADELGLYDAGAGLEALRDLGLLLAAGAQRWRFRHALVRDGIAETAPGPWRAQVHAAALRYYRDSGADLARVAHHAVAAGAAEAGALQLAVAERARTRQAYLEAEQAYTRALAVLPAEAARERMQALAGRGRMRYRQDRYQDAGADFAAADALADALGDRATQIDVLLDAATARDWSRDFTGAHELVDRARALALATGSGTPPTAPIELRLALAEARCQWRRAADPRQVCAALEAVAGRAEGLGDDGYEALIIALLLLVDLWPELGEVERAEAAAARALGLAEVHGDVLHLGAVLINRRHIWVARGQVERIIADAERVYALGSEFGLVLWLYLSTGNRAEFLYQSGALGPAWTALEEALALERDLFADGSSRYVALLRARMLAYEGRAPEARVALAELEPERMSPWEQRMCTLVELSSRDGEEAAWEELYRRCRDAPVYYEPIEVAELCGLHWWRRGRSRAAVRWLEEAAVAAERMPNIMGPRVQATLARVRAAVDALHGG